MHNTPSPHKCVYYLDANHLYGYLPLKNCSTTPIHEPAAKYDLTLTYFTHDTYSKRTNIKLVLPTDFSLQPNEIKYFSFKIPLPDDCYRIAPTSILRPKAKWQTDSYTLVSLNLYPQKTAIFCPARRLSSHYSRILSASQLAFLLTNKERIPHGIRSLYLARLSYLVVIIAAKESMVECVLDHFGFATDAEFAEDASLICIDGLEAKAELFACFS